MSRELENLLIEDMTKLNIMFYFPRITIYPDGNTKISYHWTNKEAKKTYQNCKMLLDFLIKERLKEEYETEAAQDRQFNRKKNINRYDCKHKIPQRHISSD